MSQPPNQPYPGQPDAGQPYPGQPAPNPGQPWSSPPGPGQPAPNPGQPWSSPPGPGQPAANPGQPWSSPPGPAQAGYPEPPSGEQPWSSPPGPAQPGYPGQPYQGQPNPDVPSSVPPQPGYPPQPAYGPQQSYPQPGYAQPGYPQPGYPAPAKKSRALPITLVSVALVLVLCVGGGTAVYLAGRNTAEGLANPIASSGPTLDPTPTTTRPRRAVITIVEPRTLAGRPRVTDPKFAATIDQLEKNLARLPNTSQTVGALYGTPSKRDLVMVVAAKSFVLDPKAEVDAAFEGAAFGKLKLSGVVSVPPGPLGGAAKCGKGSDNGVAMALCAWADEGSSGLIVWYLTALSTAKDEFVTIRGQVERKSY
jgi:hypothetical protein